MNKKWDMASCNELLIGLELDDIIDKEGETKEQNKSEIEDKYYTKNRERVMFEQDAVDQSFD
ncbi:hypothetical protein ABEB36_005828 [Hypothenemus hampei]|uniref:Uncharacterized protein n=1 Tax=Hypothenemus hampei TaxID=57062 RepID=A0ABD1F272_HYPHA